MKKTIILSGLMMAAITMMAQEKMDEVFPVRTPNFATQRSLDGKRMPVLHEQNIEGTIVTEEHAVPGIRPERISAAAPIRQALTARDTVTGYLNPEGTYFLGILPNGKMSSQGVVGAWSQSLDCWTWRNTISGAYRAVKYQTLYSAEYASDCDGSKYYTTPSGDFQDSVVAKGGVLEGWYMMGEDGDAAFKMQNGKTALGWQYGTPLQIVSRNDGKINKFVLLENSFLPDSSKCKLAVGSLPTGQTTDGLWPLTNAVSTHRSKGTHLDLVASYDTLHYQDVNQQDSIVLVPHYFFGTDTFDNTSVATIITRYDKPQRALYVKNITLALGADGFNAFHKEKMVVGTLTATVADSKGNVIATSTADATNISAMSAKAGQLLTFEFKQLSDQNEVLSEGFTVDEAFTVSISGITPDQEWGLYSTPSFLYQSKSEIIAANGQHYSIDYDPYIMLNGMMTTLELWGSTNEEWMAEVGMHGDTVPVAFFSAQGINYSYECGYALTVEQSPNAFDFYSTFKPYDQSTRYWNLDIHRPSYVLMSADYEYNLTGDDDDPMTIWDYYRTFELNIYANERPVVGDCFSIAIGGKTVVFEIMHVDGETTNPDKAAQGIENTSENNTLARKLWINNQIVIVRGNNTYNMQGARLK